MTTLSLALMLVLAQEKVELEARAGSPLGVGRMTVHFSSRHFTYKPDERNWRLSEKNGRAFYAVYRLDGTAPPADMTRWVAEELEVEFLFRGDEPLEMKLELSDGQSFEAKVDTRSDRRAHSVLLKEWWDRLVADANLHARSDLYPPQVENYLVTMLAPRLGFMTPELDHPWSGRRDLDTIFGLLLGAESVRVAMQRDTFLEGVDRKETASRIMPVAVIPPSVEIPEFPDTVKVEPMALHVPSECFYVRFGSFSHFRWLRKNIDDWGGTVRDLVATRGMDYRIRKRLETHLALHETVLLTILGDTVISDVALIGTDTFAREGAAIGLIFEARNSKTLSEQLRRLRQRALNADSRAIERTVTIAGHEVSFISTPDNRVRSFYAVDGDYHLVTTSRTIARRFLEKKDRLGELKEFRYARSLMPLSRNDAVFMYLSDHFFRNIVGPHYRIEMTRRMQALAEIELVQLARLAAAAEGKPARTIKDLIDGKFLPAHFETRPDGSRTILKDGIVTDSLRGARGAFLPVPDVEIKGITFDESWAYEEFGRFYRSQWERVDPVIVGIQRKKGSQEGRERVTFDIHISPYAESQYGFLSDFLAKPDKFAVPARKGDIVTLFARFGDYGSYLVGIGDFEHTVPIIDGKLDLAWAHVPSDSFYMESDPDDESETAERPAQIRLRVGELSKMKIAPLLHTAGYLHARRASAGNVRFMHTMIDQLNVDPKEALKTARTVLDAAPVCPLGGRYILRDGAWSSTAWPPVSLYDMSEIPEKYRFPFLDWFHGLELEFSIDETSLTTHLEVEISNRK